jgi:hypothetical protein
MDMAADETETSSIIRIKKEDQDKRTNAHGNVNSERPDTVLYLREINKYPILRNPLTIDVWLSYAYCLLKRWTNMAYWSITYNVSKTPFKAFSVFKGDSNFQDTFDT